MEREKISPSVHRRMIECWSFPKTLVYFPRNCDRQFQTNTTIRRCHVRLGSTFSFRSKASRRRAEDICEFAPAEERGRSSIATRLVREREIRMRLTAGEQSHSPRDDGEATSSSTRTIPVRPRHESPRRFPSLSTGPLRRNSLHPGCFSLLSPRATSVRNVDDLLARRSNEGVRTRRRVISTRMTPPRSPRRPTSRRLVAKCEPPLCRRDTCFAQRKQRVGMSKWEREARG